MKQLSRGEMMLMGGVLIAFAMAFWGPYVPQHDHYHAFADQRAWQGLPCAMDVLTNFPFVMAGVWGLMKCSKCSGWRVGRFAWGWRNCFSPGYR